MENLLGRGLDRGLDRTSLLLSLQSNHQSAVALRYSMVSDACGPPTCVMYALVSLQVESYASSKPMSLNEVQINLGAIKLYRNKALPLYRCLSIHLQTLGVWQSKTLPKSPIDLCDFAAASGE